MAKKGSRKQQRLEHLFNRRRQEFLERIHDLPRQQILVFPADIGKNVSWGALLTLDGEVIEPPFPMRSSQADFLRALQLVDKRLAEGHFRLLIHGHEPTGVYHESWARCFHTYYADPINGLDPHLQVAHYLLNPRQVKDTRHQAGRLFHKTDWIDLAAIFDLLSRGLGLPAFLPDPLELAIRQEARLIRTYAADKRRYANAVLTVFDQLVPGALYNLRRFQHAHPDLKPLEPLVRSHPLERQRFQILVEHCPDPYALLAMTPDGLAHFFRDHGLRCGLKTAHHVLEVYRRAPLPPPPIAAILADQLTRFFGDFRYTDQRIDGVAVRLEPLLLQTPARHLLALPGTSTLLVARYLAGIGSVQRFLFADQIWSLAGFDPACYISGDLLLWGHLTKDGDPFLRDTLYHLGFCLAAACPYFGATFLTARQRGKSQTEAVLHTAHQVNRVFFALLRDDKPFDPPGIADYPAFCRHWQPQINAYFNRGRKPHSPSGKRRARPKRNPGR
jgi:transposase